MFGASVLGGATVLSAPARADDRGYDWEEEIHYTYDDQEEFEHRWRASITGGFHLYTGQTACAVEKVGYYEDDVEDDYNYVFDIESLHEADDNGDGMVTDFGVEVDVPDDWTVELKSPYDEHVRNGKTQDDNEEYPSDSREEKMKQLGEIVLDVASANPAIEAVNLLYSLIEFSDFSGDEYTYSLEFDTDSYPGEESVVFSHYDLIVRIPKGHGSDNVDFNFFTETRGGKSTLTESANLWRHS
jgi:hypothetical protein